MRESVDVPRRQRQPRIESRLSSEFGQVLERLLRSSPGARAAVFSDADGDAIDFAHDPGDLSELDVQLLAAQTGQAILGFASPKARERMGRTTIMVETPGQCLLAAPVAGTYILAMLVGRQGNLGRALSSIETARTALAAML